MKMDSESSAQRERAVRDREAQTLYTPAPKLTRQSPLRRRPFGETGGGEESPGSIGQGAR